MAKRRYLMVVEPPGDPKRELYGGWFPDLPGCFTAGKSLKHLRAMGEEAVSLYVSELARRGRGIPQARFGVEFVSVEVKGAAKPVPAKRRRPASGAMLPRRRPGAAKYAAAKNGAGRQLTVRQAGRGAKGRGKNGKTG